MKVLMIGVGNMGLTFSEGMANSPLVNNKNLLVYDKSKELRDSLKKDSRFKVYETVEDAVKDADIIFLAVKPYHSEALFEDIKDFVSNEHIVVSLMAGVTLDFISDSLGVRKVVRAMPNIPAQVSKGVTAFTENKEVSKIELLTIRNLLDSTGESIHVQDETFINKSTGISGSGPAYVFYFMQSMLDAALKMGFSAYDSKVLVSNTFEGAVKLFKENDITPEKWIDKVASKGGTTEAAIESMEDNNVNKLIKEAAYAAFHRAVELGKENS